MYGLIDCNAFYCSCQRAFDPSLKHQPVVVLSNNDGCAISRTAEAKALGIGMGEAWYLVRGQPRLAGVAWYSSNYPLYADMSRRVCQVLQEHVPSVEVYSIDEMFLDLGGLEGDLLGRCRDLRRTVEQVTKIPTCVGWGPTQDTFTLLGHARTLLRTVWKEGYRYTKAGVTLNDLAPCNRQTALFGGNDTRGLKASQAMDAVNRKFGQGSLQLLGAGLEPRWKSRQQMRSPRYTTQLSEIMEAVTF
ncbi:Y-family DNA polymerase [Acetobacter vaccinii]|uniref:DUF4113 domain-containing protein n=1 Tax=Acetobacter vaccinii TaxID=2592655 RepID=A0A5C1YRC0_9PROT|nr:DUF4113 domain-containing protein [Acetobacter vaccinii]QEO18904.1 DUF4113 domain-containing protein [Acetobacter vaccinii]